MRHIGTGALRTAGGCQLLAQDPANMVLPTQPLTPVRLLCRCFSAGQDPDPFPEEERIVGSTRVNEVHFP